MYISHTEVRELGRGTFGRAILVKRGTQHLVLKKVSMESMEPRHRDFQLQEAKVLKDLSHPNIVFYKGCEQRGHTLHLYMEYCEGGDLLQAIRAKAPDYFPEDTVRAWVRQLASALEYVHKKRILHRDLKPSNVFLNSDKTSLQLGDFGLARVFSSGSLGVTHTTLGTLAYMAPEVFRGQPYDAKADMYSLGACVFHITSLTPRRHGAEVPANFSVALRRLIESLLSDLPGNRPTAEAVLGDAALGPPPDQITIIVHGIDGVVASLKVSPATTTVEDVKQKIHSLRGIDPSSVSVVFSGTTLKEQHTLTRCRVKHGDNLRIILKYVGGDDGGGEVGGGDLHRFT